MNINTAIPIYRIPKYTNEAQALGVSDLTVLEYANILLHKIDVGTLRQPVYLDSTGKGAAICDILRIHDIKVIEFHTYLIRE